MGTNIRPWHLGAFVFLLIIGGCGVFLIQDLNRAVKQLTARSTEVERREGQLRGELTCLQADTSSTSVRLDALTTRGDATATRVEALSAARDVLTTQVANLRSELHAVSTSATTLDTAGLGRRVAILFDVSQSMRNDNERWKHAIRQMRQWLRQTSVQECVLITFSDKVKPDPNENYCMLCEMDSEKREKQIATWVAAVNAADHTTVTDMLAALKMAYEWTPGPDSIYLFSDGRPELNTERDPPGTFDHARRTILDWIEGWKGPRIPINAVLLCYPDSTNDPKESVSFIHDLVVSTGGSFRGW